jgi:hypothetical protein
MSSARLGNFRLLLLLLLRVVYMYIPHGTEPSSLSVC